MNKALAEGLRAFARCLEQIEDTAPQRPDALPAEDYGNLNYQSLEEAAQALGVSLPKMRTIVHRADFPGYKIGTRWVVPKKSLAEWNAKMAAERAEL